MTLAWSSPRKSFASLKLCLLLPIPSLNLPSPWFPTKIGSELRRMLLNDGVTSPPVLIPKVASLAVGDVLFRPLLGLEKCHAALEILQIVCTAQKSAGALSNVQSWTKHQLSKRVSRRS